MRKKIIGIVICTLVIATVLVPMTGIANINSKQNSVDNNYGLINPYGKFAFSGKGRNVDYWGITESINIKVADTIYLVYLEKFHIYPIGGQDMGYVKISDDGGSSWTKIAEFQGSAQEWTPNIIDITEWAGETVKIAFEYVTKDDSISQGWYIDNMFIDAEGEEIFTEDFEDYNLNDYWEDWIIRSDITPPPNYPPEAPEINGPKNGKINEPLTYSFESYDPDLEGISYYIEWGDGTITKWTDFKPSGAWMYDEAHIWTEEGTYTIRAKGKDINEYESGWSEFTVRIKKGRDRQFTNMLFIKLLEQLLARFIKLFPTFDKVIEFPVTI